MRFVVVVLAFVGAAVSAQVPAKHFLWKVEAPNGAAAYLLGSLHVLAADSYPLPAPIDKAFEQSKTLVEEVDLDEMTDPMAMMGALSKAMLTNGQTLDQIVAPATYAEVKKRAAATGMPILALDRMKPWLVAVTLMAPTLEAAGFKPEFGVDRHFFDRAKAKGLKRQALETIAYQLDRFDSMPMPVQEALLKATIEDLDTQVSGVKEMVRAWATGDLAAVEKLTLTAFKDSPELYRALLVERNENWVPHVEKCLSDNAGCFIVVGAAHLVGRDGLPALLAKKGLKVTQQ
ncbi:MAG TPA: TraB/GumN family protein [Vicinamibacterales bacterium]|nr:TraB/GumN family protein [Vicinamibacterales bacterium]